MTNQRHKSERKIFIMQMILIVIISAVIAGVVGGVTGTVSKWNSKAVVPVTNATSAEKRGIVWAGGAGHRREGEVVRLFGVEGA